MSDDLSRQLGSLGDGNEVAQAQAAAAQREQMLTAILNPEAKERLNRIKMVKEQKARAIEELLLQQARAGQLRYNKAKQSLIHDAPTLLTNRPTITK
jgi:programmed cell death protein 5